MLAQLHEQFPNEVRIVYRHFPLSQHDKALLAAQAAEAAGLQGKFWEMHDLIFAEQSSWEGQTPAQFEDWLKSQAPNLGLNAAQFAADLTRDTIAQKALQAQVDAEKAGIGATPTLFLNGVPYSGAIQGGSYSGPVDLQSLTAIVKLKLLEARQFTGCPPMTIDPHKQYLATLKTDKGDIVIQLYPDKAPMTVNSFVFLAQHGWFDGITFHRVIPGFVAQSGDPSGTGYGTPGYAFGDEISPDLNFDKAGMVGMANAGPGSNGSQFFITLLPTSELNGKYTVFGEVIQGLDVAKTLAPRNPQAGVDLPPGDKIISVVIVEK